MAEPQPTPPDALQRMYDADGVAHDVPASEAPALYQSGRLGFKADQQVIVQTPSGEFAPMSGADAGRFFDSSASAFANVASPAEYAEQQQRGKFEGLGNELAGAAYGIGKGLTLGTLPAIATTLASLGDTSDVAATRQWMRSQEKYNPGLVTSGEVAGMALPLLASGGSGAAVRGGLAARGLAATAEAASLPLRAASAIGRGAEALAGGALERAGIGASSGLGRVLTTAAGASAENALYGAGQVVGEAALKGDDVTAEKVLAGAGWGALVGAGAGASLSGLGQLLRGGVSLGGRLGEKVAQKAETIASDMFDHKGGEFLESLAQENAIKGTGGRLKEVRKLAERGEDAQAHVTKRILDELPEYVGKEKGQLLSKAEQSEAAQAMVRKDGQKFESLWQDLEKAAPDAKANIHYVIADAAQRLAPLEQQFGAHAEVNAALNLLEDVQAKGEGLSVRELHAKRADLDRRIYDAGQNKTLRSVYQEARGAVEDELDRVMREHAGSELAERYHRLKRDYAAAKWIEKATFEGATAESKNRLNGLSEQFGSARGASLGQGLGALVGGLAGGMQGAAMLGTAGHFVGGALGAAAQHLGRKYGAQAIAVVAHKAATDGVVRAAVQTVDKNFSHAVGELVKSSVVLRAAKGAASGAASVARRTRLVAPITAEATRLESRSANARQESFDQKRAAVASVLAQGPDAARAHVAGIADTHPELADRVAQKTVTAAQFLQSKLPPTLAKHDLLAPQLDKGRAAPADVAKWLRYEKAVSDPLSVVHDALSNRASREGVEALKAVYPEMYQELVVRPVTDALAERKDPLPYATQLQLGVLLDIPSRAAFTPAFAQAMRQVYGADPVGNAPGGSKGRGAPPSPHRMAPSRPINVSGAFQTHATRLVKG